MNTHYYILLLFLLGLVSCSGDDMVVENEIAANGDIKISLTAKREGIAYTRSSISDGGNGTLTSSWKAGDVIYVYNSSAQVGKLTCQQGGTTGYFTGTINSTDQFSTLTSNTYNFFYLGRNNESCINGNTFQLDLAPVPNLADLEKYDLAYARATLSGGSGGEYSFSAIFSNLLSFVYIDVTNTGAVTFNKAVKISDLTSSSTPVLEKVHSTSSTLTSPASGTCYLPFIPATETCITGLASTTGSGYVCFLPPFVSTAGKLYTASDSHHPYKMIKDGHEAVDMGVPSGLYWAKWNIGATSETEYGNYYGWGGTTNQSNTDYVSSSIIPPDGPTLTAKGYDTATKLWGANWRMPTKEECDALLLNTDAEWTQINGINGRKFTDKRDPNNYVFFPAAGYFGGSFSNQSTGGGYWSSTPNTSNGDDAWVLGFHSGLQLTYSSHRYGGRSVRAVLRTN